MERSYWRLGFWIPASLLGVAACVTVNVYFPAAQVERTAERIVGDVYRQGAEEAQPQKPPAPDPAEKPRSSLDTGRSGRALAWFGPAEALADEGRGDRSGRDGGRDGRDGGDRREATTVSNAAIRALKDQIAQRHQELLPFYQGGQVGIDRRGYLEVRSTAGLPLPQVANLKRLVEADNAARRQLYQEVGRALELKADQTGRVEEIFAKEWRDKAQNGWSVQKDDGRWDKK
jgi:uncharacterized protein YdbL (DUF1318 family)